MIKISLQNFFRKLVHILFPGIIFPIKLLLSSVTYFLVILVRCIPFTAQKMKFSIKDFFSKCDQIRRNLWIWSHLLKKSILENFIFCAVFIGEIATDRDYSGLLIVFLGVFFGPQKFIIIHLIDYLLRRLVGISPLFASV